MKWFVVRRLLKPIALIAAATLLAVLCSPIGWPFLFGGGLLFLAVVAMILSFDAVRQRLPWPSPIPSRAALASLVVVLALGFVALSFYVVGRRQNPWTVTASGVWRAYTEQAIRIGVGDSALDWRLAGDASLLEEWSLHVRPMPNNASFLLDSLQGIDAISVRGGENATGRIVRRLFGVRGSARFVAGAALSHEHGVLVRRAGTGDTLKLLAIGRRGSLSWGRDTVKLERVGLLSDSLLLADLRIGLPIRRLPWQRGIASVPDVAVTLAGGAWYCAEGRSGLLARISRWATGALGTPCVPRYQVVPRAPDIIVRALPDTVLVGDTIEVRSGSGRWKFTVDTLRRSAYDRHPATTMHFVIGPRPASIALPARDQCGPDAGGACVMVASFALPPPTASINLSVFGLDTAAYSYLAQVTKATTGLLLIGARRQDALPFETETAIGADTLAGGLPEAGYLFKTGGRKAAQPGRIYLAVLLLGIGVVAALFELDRHTAAATRRPASVAFADAAWGMLHIFIVLGAVRLALGLRVAFAAPRVSRAADTAIWMWMGFPILLLLCTEARACWNGVRSWWDQSPELLVRRGDAPSNVQAFLAACMAVPGFCLCIMFPQGFTAGVVMIGLFIVSLAASTNAWPWQSASLLSAVQGRDVKSVWCSTVALAAMAVAAKWPLGGGAIAVALLLLRPVRDRMPGAARSAAVGAAVLGIAFNLASAALHVPSISAISSFAVVFSLFVLSVRIGYVLYSLGPERTWAANVLLVLMPPLVAILVLGIIDVGLALVITVPVILTVVLASGLRTWEPTVAIAFGALLIALARPILVPPPTPLAPGLSAAAKSAAFCSLGSSTARALVNAPVVGKIFGPSIGRAVVRGWASSSPEVLERALVFSGPCPALAMVRPALEQTHGIGAYVASAGLLGAGFAQFESFDFGVSWPVSVAEQTIAVYVLGEGGIGAGIGVLTIYLALVLTSLLFVLRTRDQDNLIAVRALVLGGVFFVVLPSCYVMASNFLAISLTGQNVSGLGLASWSDVLLTGGLAAAIVGTLFSSSHEPVQ